MVSRSGLPALKLLERLAEWLNIRPAEIRILVLSVLGAFFILAFMVLASAMREGFYLGLFSSSTLPYVLYASLVVGLPAVAVFSRFMARSAPYRVMRVVTLTTGVGLLALYTLVRLPASPLDDRIAAVMFYLWTIVAVLLLTSGLWITISEVFAVREAKRLFGLISAGGAMGTLLAGVSLSQVPADFDTVRLVPVLIAVLILAQVTIELLPRGRLGSRDGARSDPGRSAGERLREVMADRHIRLIAAIVLLTSAASYIVAWQLQETIQAVAEREASLAALTGFDAARAVTTRVTTFMGAFRGWTGGLSFVIQVFVAARLLSGAGVAWSLAVLPLALLFGSAGMLVAPGLVMATLVRGADTTLGKSLYRSVAELLWIPVDPVARRRSKAFIDSMVSNAGDGLGALVVLLWVTFGHLPSRWLSAFVIVFTVALVALSRAMGTQYFATLRRRLERSGNAEVVLEGIGLDRADRLGATVTRLDITRVLATAEIESRVPPPSSRAPTVPGETEALPATPSGWLRSGEPELIERALATGGPWVEDDLPFLVPLVARDAWLDATVRALATMGSSAVPYLSSILADESADFVIRRRIPGVFARIDDPDADHALIGALNAARFEVRYRVALALYRRRIRSMAESDEDWRAKVWEAIRFQLGREKPVWELARLLDPAADDGFVERRVGMRGELSFEHTFRLLSLVLDRDTVRAAYHGIVLNDPELRSFALEYLEQVLPPDVRDRLWPFIGDLSESAERRALRDLDAVVADLLKTGATLFGSEEDREALRRYIARPDTGES